MMMEKIALICFIVLALILLPFYAYILVRFIGEAILKTVRFFEIENTTKNKEK